ncbi:hypothetical protein BOTBODRAFT_60600 [Botryobasidium botryosum FD-172 SS1]|uniref:Uncharacterized protein n=1 Tax=Botryobasidium botryosum (strain FD-172 SS1) TaxID=930990 RepID=A0A067M3J3_BOTB1|nr:hypothetical protein BOTBODRAFT_60600 [Botryobasidium botryosum FD-172 SS1]
MADFWDNIAQEGCITAVKGPTRQLWEKTWSRGTTDLLAFHTPTRDPDEGRRASSGVRVWSGFWGLNFPPEFEWGYGGLGPMGILIRKDYVTVLKDTIAWANGGDSMDFDKGDPDDDEDEPVGEVENPFLTLETAQPTLPRIFILNGHMGVGKTMWLIYTLVLRLLAGLPTIFVDNSWFLYIFNQAGVFELKGDYASFEYPAKHGFKAAINEDYWCLVDSTNTLIGVPYFILSLNRFVVQAASPRADRTAWIRKAPSAHVVYYMKSWTLSELIAGREFQRPREIASEADLEAHCAKHVPVARIAYRDSRAAMVRSFNRSVQNAMGSFALGDIVSLIEKLRSMDVKDGDDCHDYLLISPTSGNRTHFNTDVPSRYIYHLIRKAHSASSYQGAARLYTSLTRFPQTSRTAGYILEEHFHRILAEGGEWRVKPLARSGEGLKSVIWSCSDDFNNTSGTTHHYLHVGHQSPPRPFVAISGSRFPQNTEYSELQIRGLVSYDAHFQLNDGHYYLSASDPPTFDGFTYTSATNTATLYQIAVPSMQPIRLQEIEQLQQLGVDEFHYIVVTPPGEARVPICKDVDRHFAERYQLIVKSWGTRPSGVV